MRLLIKKSDVINKFPEIFKRVVWENDVAILEYLRTTHNSYITTIHYIHQKTGEVTFLEVPSHLVKLIK